MFEPSTGIKACEQEKLAIFLTVRDIVIDILVPMHLAIIGILNEQRGLNEMPVAAS